ncbi:hypothetical protein H9L13_00290 [Sphingomonas lutea]|uniref:Uncharacterized protein n=1 Tax=Sphingomonas lutea TaxID=1045317 RepID=A0A7G9SLG0_9SPHN|nr:hypothetical protein [Sphingomonas lutea]QNN68685.1 hypothetical protein H9L13_00290 [Sphingomonas lutea]
MTAGLARQAGVGALADKNAANRERLAAALRENLRRRKAQAREIGADGDKKNED